MGFCIFNNAAVAAASIAAGGERVLLVDIDAHHGNGTQDIFYERGDVAYVSWHQQMLYPGTGASCARVLAKVQLGVVVGHSHFQPVNTRANPSMMSWL